MESAFTLRCLHPWGVAVTGKGTKAEAFSRALAAESIGREIWRHKLISFECFQKYCDKFLRAVSTYPIKVSDFFRELLLLFIFIDFFLSIEIISFVTPKFVSGGRNGRSVIVNY